MPAVRPDGSMRYTAPEAGTQQATMTAGGVVCADAVAAPVTMPAVAASAAVTQRGRLSTQNQNECAGTDGTVIERGGCGWASTRHGGDTARNLERTRQSVANWAEAAELGVNSFHARWLRGMHRPQTVAGDGRAATRRTSGNDTKRLRPPPDAVCLF
jgi:hypothetical protein